MKREIATTFSQTLRYKCVIDKCEGCCEWFEDIPVYEDEIGRVEKLGYTDFNEKIDNKLFLKRPCPFLYGKLCKIHLDHGYRAKFSTCKKYPFIVNPLKNGKILVDIKWTCPGVNIEEGDLLDRKYIVNEVLRYVDLKTIPISPQGKDVYFSEERNILIDWNALARLYRFFGDLTCSLPVGVYERLVIFTDSVRFFTGNIETVIKGRRDRKITVRDVNALTRKFLDKLQREGLEKSINVTIKSTQIPASEGEFFEALQELLAYDITPKLAMNRLNITFRRELRFDMTRLFSMHFSKDSVDLYTLYLSQGLMEALSRPWDFLASYFWVLGVMSFVDALSRSFASANNKKIVGYEDFRKAIRVVDYLNKGFKDFRSFAYPLYPELGMRYIQHVFSIPKQ